MLMSRRRSTLPFFILGRRWYCLGTARCLVTVGRKTSLASFHRAPYSNALSYPKDPHTSHGSLTKYGVMFYAGRFASLLVTILASYDAEGRYSTTFLLRVAHFQNLFDITSGSFVSPQIKLTSLRRQLDCMRHLRFFINCHFVNQ
jgi:hypothetical protein